MLQAALLGGGAFKTLQRPAYEFGITLGVDDFGCTFAGGNAARKKLLDRHAAASDRAFSLIGDAKTARSQGADDAVAGNNRTGRQGVRIVTHFSSRDCADANRTAGWCNARTSHSLPQARDHQNHLFGINLNY